MGNYKQILPAPAGWEVVLHEREGEGVYFAPVAYFALTEQGAVVPLIADMLQGPRDELTEPCESEVVGIAAPGEAKERFWEDMAEAQRDEERAEDREHESKKLIGIALEKITPRGKDLLVRMLDKNIPEGGRHDLGPHEMKIDPLEELPTLVDLIEMGLVHFERECMRPSWRITVHGRDVARILKEKGEQA